MLRAARTQRIDLVKEDDAGRGVTSSLKHLPDGPLALAHILHTHQILQFTNQDYFSTKIFPFMNTASKLHHCQYHECDPAVISSTGISVVITNNTLYKV